MHWVHIEMSGDQPRYRLGHEGDVVVAEWANVASFRSDRTPPLIPCRGADPDRLRKVSTGPARMIERALCGLWSLHGAAVSVEGEGHLVIGQSGAGKSTLGVTLVDRFGGALLADDVAFVDVVDGAYVVSPSEREHWVDGQTLQVITGSPHAPDLQTKVPISARLVATQPVPLRTICEVLVAGSPGPTEVRRLRGTEAMEAVSRAMFLVPPHRPTTLSRHLDAVADIARDIPVFRLIRDAGVERDAVATTYRRGIIDVSV